MIVSRDQARLIIAGRKTQHRVPVTDHARARRNTRILEMHGRQRYTPQAISKAVGVSVSTVYAVLADPELAGRGARYEPGRSYPVLVRGGGTIRSGRRAGARCASGQVCRVVIAGEPRLEALGLVDNPAANAEGFHDFGEFEDYWLATHGWYDPDTLVRVIRFRLDRDDQPRWMHRHSERGYTSSLPEALAGEPEAVDPLWQQRFSDTARARLDLVKREDTLKAQARTLGRLVRQRTLEADGAGVDIRQQLGVIRAELDQIERMLREVKRLKRRAA